MIFKRFVVGALEVNCFVIADSETKEGIVVDPGDNADQIIDFIAKNGIIVKYVINTHCHFDHIGGNKKIVEATKAELLIHESELPLLERAEGSAALWGFKVEASPQPSHFLKDGDTLKIGNIIVEVIHTPGHSPGGICLKFDNKLISGDTLFAGGVGRTDFPGGDGYALIKSIKEKLFTLPDSTEVYPGHGPSTTIGNEKLYNPFF